MDYDSGTVLFEKAADEPFEPASMAKLMTVEYVFNELKEGRVKETTCSPSPSTPGGRAARRPAARPCIAELNSSVPVHDLLRGLIVQSGNDAAIVLAEGIAGSEPAFADLLNKRAEELGLKNSRFQNANGLHDPDQMVTARDLAILARHIIRDYPDYYPIFSEPEFTWNKIRQTNRNPLLGDGIGVDGLKTGFIKESGYGIVASALRNEQRLILVVAGLDSERGSRGGGEEAARLGFSQFPAGDRLRRRTRWWRRRPSTAATSGACRSRPTGAIRILVARDAKDALKARVVYQGPLMAPVEAGVEVGIAARSGAATA